MKAFLQRMRANDAVAQQAKLTLSVFGKHPGWDDHILGIGSETEQLERFKQLLYVKGIGAQVDSGGWEKLVPERRAEGFNHIFLWSRAGSLFLGALWSSQDAKGRSKYPMVLCIESQGLSAAFLIRACLQTLATLKDACIRSKSASEVISYCKEAQDELNRRLAAADVELNQKPDLSHRQAFMNSAEFGERQVGLRRVWHELAAVPGLLKGKRPPVDPKTLSCRIIRVPPGAGTFSESALLWAELLRVSLQDAVPFGIVSRNNATWMDLVIGDPVGEDLAFLQLGLAGMPRASDVPYELTQDLDALIRDAETRFIEINRGADALPDPATVRSPSNRKNITILGAVVLFIALAGIVATLMPSSKAKLVKSGARDAANSVSTPPGISPSELQPGHTSVPESHISTARVTEKAQENGDVGKPVEPAPENPLPKASLQPEAPQAVSVAGGSLSSSSVMSSAESPVLAPSKSPEPALLPSAPSGVTAQAEPAPLEAITPTVPEANAIASIPNVKTKPESAQSTGIPVAPAETAVRAKIAAPVETLAETGSKQSEPGEQLPLITAPAAPPAVGFNAALNTELAIPKPLMLAKSRIEFIWSPSLKAMVSKAEITREQYKSVVGSLASMKVDLEGKDIPVMGISGAEAQQFCELLSRMESRKITLLKFEEWQQFSGVTNENAKWDDFGGRKNEILRSRSPLATGGRNPGSDGFYDVLGNVREWVEGARGYQSVGFAYNAQPGNPRVLVLPENKDRAWLQGSTGIRCVMRE